MFGFYNTNIPEEKIECYNEIRDVALGKFKGAELVEDNGLFSIVWNGVSISDNTKTAYEAWLDVVLPF